MRFFISFEGVEGSGKSTQAGLLASRFGYKGIKAVLVREPGGTGIGEKIREITHARENIALTAESEAYLMAASRAQLVREIIAPSLEEDKVVIADRYIDSSLAYQGYGRKLGEDTVFNLNKIAMADFQPDVTFFLDIEPLIGVKRRNSSGKLDRLDLQDERFYQRVYHGYKLLAKKFKDRIITINTRESIEKVSGEIWGIIESRFQNKLR